MKSKPWESRIWTQSECKSFGRSARTSDYDRKRYGSDLEVTRKEWNAMEDIWTLIRCTQKIGEYSYSCRKFLTMSTLICAHLLLYFHSFMVAGAHLLSFALVHAFLDSFPLVHCCLHSFALVCGCWDSFAFICAHSCLLGLICSHLHSFVLVHAHQHPFSLVCACLCSPPPICAHSSYNFIAL